MVLIVYFACFRKQVSVVWSCDSWVLDEVRAPLYFRLLKRLRHALFCCLCICCVLGMFVLMYSRGWERGYKFVCNLHMIEKMYVCCDALYIGFRLCDCLHEHIWMRASDRTTRGFCLCDYPVYAKENICHAFHSCVPRCMSVWLCLRIRRLTVWLRQILLDFIELVFVCVAHLVFVCVAHLPFVALWG